MASTGTVHTVPAVTRTLAPQAAGSWPGMSTASISGIGLPPPPTMPAPPLMQTATQMAPLQPTAQVQTQPIQTQPMHPQTMPHLQPVHSATAVPPPPMSTASAVVAQSSHYVMQQALSLQPNDMIKVYESLRKHLHSEGLLRGMSVSARTKRRVMCLKDSCPGRAFHQCLPHASPFRGKLRPPLLSSYAHTPTQPADPPSAHLPPPLRRTQRNADAMTASKKQATCKDGKNCGYHAQWGCTVCEEGKVDFKRCVC
jgi:hypothetical protein